MNEKLTLQELIDALAARHQMEPQDADAFVKAFWALIEEGLKNDSYVKIKGFGTFKLIDTEARESINIQTGERIEIQSHARITFTPDASLRDQINRPFAHFETVVLKDSTQFEGLDGKDVLDADNEAETEDETDDLQKPDQTVDEKPVEQEVAEIDRPKQEETEKESLIEIEEVHPTEVVEGRLEEEKGTTAELVEEQEVTPEQVQEQDVQEDSLEQSAPATELNHTDDVESQVNVVPSKEEMTSEKTQESSKPSVTPSVSVEEEKPVSPKNPVQEEPVDDSLQEKVAIRENTIEETSEEPEKDLASESAALLQEFQAESKPHKKLIGGIVAAVFLIGIFVGGGISLWILNRQEEKVSPLIAVIDSLNSTVSELVEGQTDTLVLVTQVNSVDAHIHSLETAVAVPGEDKRSNPPTTDAKALAEQDHKTTSQATEIKSSPAPDAFLSEDVPYKIVGTIDTHTIKRGDSLTKLARKYYGNKKLWTYIVKHNKAIIKNPNNVPIGTTLRIPKLEPLEG